MDAGEQDNALDYKAIVQERIKNAEQKIREKTGDSGTGDGGMDSDFIMKCLARNELGDGELFKHLFRGYFIFNESMGGWMKWAGHHWEVDKENAAALAAVEGWPWFTRMKPGRSPEKSTNSLPRIRTSTVAEYRI